MSHTTPAESIKFILKDLRAKFTATEFSVRSEEDEIHVAWIDGPTRDSVSDVVKPYKRDYKSEAIYVLECLQHHIKPVYNMIHRIYLCRNISVAQHMITLREVCAEKGVDILNYTVVPNGHGGSDIEGDYYCQPSLEWCRSPTRNSSNPKMAKIKRDEDEYYRLRSLRNLAYPCLGDACPCKRGRVSTAVYHALEHLPI